MRAAFGEKVARELQRMSWDPWRRGWLEKAVVKDTLGEDMS